MSFRPEIDFTEEGEKEVSLHEERSQAHSLLRMSVIADKGQEKKLFVRLLGIFIRTP